MVPAPHIHVLTSLEGPYSQSQSDGEQRGASSDLQNKTLSKLATFMVPN